MGCVRRVWLSCVYGHMCAAANNGMVGLGLDVSVGAVQVVIPQVLSSFDDHPRPAEHPAPM